MQYYDINIAVNGVRPIQVQGDYVYYLSGSAGGADSTIVLQAQTGSEKILLKPGQAFRLGTGQKNINWTVSNYANAAAIVGVLLMGEGEFSDNRISGSVEVIDGGKNRTLGQSAFLAPCSQAGVAAVNAHTQLWNPVGSTKNVIVKSLIISAAAAAPFDFGITATPLTNAYVYPPNSKLSNGAASVAQSRNQNNAGILITTTLLVAGYVGANQPLSIVLNEPIVLRPGSGLTIGLETVNTNLITAIEYFEEAV